MDKKNSDGIMDAINLACSIDNDATPMINGTIRKLALEIINYTESKGCFYLIEINSEIIKLLATGTFSIEDIHNILKEYDIDYII